MEKMQKLQFLNCKKYSEVWSTVKNCNFSKLQFFQCSSTVITLHIFAVRSITSYIDFGCIINTFLRFFMNQSLCTGERSYKMTSFLISENVKNFSHKKQYPTEKIQVAIYHVIHKRVRNRDKNI